MVDISKMPLLPGAHYGTIKEEPEAKEDDDSPLPDVEGIDDDDDEDRPTDPSLIAMLGFDPKEWEDEEETVKNADGSISKRK